MGDPSSNISPMDFSNIVAPAAPATPVQAVGSANQFTAPVAAPAPAPVVSPQQQAAQAHAVNPKNPLNEQALANNALDTKNVVANQPFSPYLNQTSNPTNPYAMVNGANPSAPQAPLQNINYGGALGNAAAAPTTVPAAVPAAVAAPAQPAVAPTPGLVSNNYGGFFQDVTNAISTVPLVGPAVGGLFGAVTGTAPGSIGAGYNVAPTNTALLNQGINNLGFQQGSVTNLANNQLGASNDSQAQNLTALSLLQGAASGNAPSAAQAQLQAGNDQAINQQMAMANSGNISQMMGGQRNAMQNAAAMTQQNANQAAQLRAQEMATARGQYGGATGGTLSTNLGAATNLANLQQGAAGATTGAMQNAASLQQQQAIAASGASLANTGQMLGVAGQIGGGLASGAGAAGISSLFGSGGAGAGAATAGGAAGAGAGAASFGAAGPLILAAYKGGEVEGEAKKPGDHPANDTEHYMLSPGEIVIPRSHAGSIKSSVKFLEELHKKNKDSDNSNESYFKNKKREK